MCLHLKIKNNFLIKDVLGVLQSHNLPLDSPLHFIEVAYTTWKGDLSFGIMKYIPFCVTPHLSSCFKHTAMNYIKVYVHQAVLGKGDCVYQQENFH